MNAGDPSVITSLHPGFVYATGDATNLYNRPNQWTPADNAIDIVFAVRSIVWLKPDHVVVYDRAKSLTPDRFKRFFLQFTAPPVIAGKNAVVSTPGGQKIFLSNLLPAAAVLTTSVSENFNEVAQLDPTHDQIKIEDPANPIDIRFLNIVQGADGNTVKDSVLLVQSTAGTAFDGVVLNNTAILFINLWNAPFSFTTYQVPASVTTQIVTGLTPGGGYDATIVPAGSFKTVTITPGTQLTADGVLLIPAGMTNASNRLDTALPGLQIEPNPFVGNSTIYYSLPSAGRVTLKIYDLLGNTVAALLENQEQAAGEHNFVFVPDGLPSGVYVCVLTMNGVRLSRRMVVSR